MGPVATRLMHRPVPSVLRHLTALVMFVAASHSHAGAQQYEPLSAAVQARMQRSIADHAAPRIAIDDPYEAEVWLKTMSSRLASRMPDEATRTEFLTSVHYEATRSGLDPHLVLGLIQVESNFRKYALSSAGARGFMQVMPFWPRLIGSPDHNLFHLRTSLRYGCTILRHYLDIERGDMTRALLRYNGSLVKGSDYADKVIRNWRTRWSLDAPATADAAPARATPPASAASPSVRIRVREERAVRTPPRTAPSAPVTYMGPAS
jgi:soluble lytic murein transglycosylase-like protein